MCCACDNACIIARTDINECETDNGGCDDNCTDTDGSFYCGCDTAGYEVGPDALTCVGKN